VQGSPGLREMRELRASRRHPRRTQFDYLHLRILLEDIRRVIASISPQPSDVLDVFCGSRPYDDLLPPRASITGLDVIDRYGVADIVTDAFLPLESASFDLVMCIEAFQYVIDPAAAQAELLRVLRPGGSLILAVPFVWEYNRASVEHRFTEWDLRSLFSHWESVVIFENGGRVVSWATLTGTLIQRCEGILGRRLSSREIARRFFAPAYVTLNVIGALGHSIELRADQGPTTLPMNLLLTCRKPSPCPR
jgi:SAM-dependent methyltransferase